MAGGLLVAIAILGVFALLGGGGAPTTRYAVAREDIDPGARLDDGSVSLQAVDLPESLAASAFTDPAALRGAVALAPLRAGELVQRGAVLRRGADTPAGRFEVSFRVERERAVDGTLNRGEHVDLLATFGEGQTASTWVVLRDALVIDVVNDARDDLAGGDRVSITLGLRSHDEVLRATHAVDVGKVTFVRTTGHESDGEGTDHVSSPDG